MQILYSSYRQVRIFIIYTNRDLPARCVNSSKGAMLCAAPRPGRPASLERATAASRDGFVSRSWGL